MVEGPFGEGGGEGEFFEGEGVWGEDVADGVGAGVDVEGVEGGEGGGVGCGGWVGEAAEGDMC